MKPTILAICAGLLAAWGCSSSSNSGPPGGPVSGALDTHCDLPDGGMMVQVTSQASCTPEAGFDAGTTSDYGATLYNSEGDDDDCKYHVKWTSNAIYENTNVTFNVVATSKVDGSPVTGAYIIPEVFLNSMHPGPNTNEVTTENPPGTYQVGPIQFDEPGQWTVRFHLFENCADEDPASPHGHAAFYVSVP